MQVADLREFRRSLLAWYKANRRDLPWRKTRDPYRVWVSEIMLQQTRVAAVLMRYEQFLRRFPNAAKLAAARESSVLAQWSGLGYYRRARSLHAAAKIISREFGGRFPRTAEQWLTLPGIGRYTAAAIASIVFDEPVAVLDGNVERVLGRLLGRSHRQKALWEKAQLLLDRERPGDFNQAMMELGAVICLPAQPQCAMCPVASFCRTRGRGRAYRQKSRSCKREIYHSLAQKEGSILLTRRSDSNTLMPRMWELPEVRPRNVKALFSVRHAITVTNFTVQVVEGRCEKERGTWVRVSRLKTLPLTGLTQKILRRAGIIQWKRGQ